ncbi:hypothetical protein MN032_10980 [Agromyces atrinae]|uniref:hypothetical protein n=1 Tax=Agromyces atrinae TaxID=592376 RepID=UPI001F563AAD|nr:hypothetical protein [Agromyces atrinae]MCI2958221.1 hypothetical protein [Agromyces atrinae]
MTDQHTIEQLAMFQQQFDAREYGVTDDADVSHPTWAELDPLAHQQYLTEAGRLVRALRVLGWVPPLGDDDATAAAESTVRAEGDGEPGPFVEALRQVFVSGWNAALSRVKPQATHVEKVVTDALALLREVYDDGSVTDWSHYENDFPAELEAILTRKEDTPDD